MGAGVYLPAGRLYAVVSHDHLHCEHRRADAVHADWHDQQRAELPMGARQRRGVVLSLGVTRIDGLRSRSVVFLRKHLHGYAVFGVSRNTNNNYTAGVNRWWVQAYSTGGGYSPWGAEQQFIYVTPTATPTATFTPTHTSTPTSWTCIVDFRTGQHEYVNRNPVTLVSHT